MKKKVIYTQKAPEAVGPYSQAIEINDALYISGQIALSPETGTIVSGGIREQTEQVLKNIENILLAAGYTRDNVVKSTCLLDNMDNFQTMNEVYGHFYSENPPARAAYEVAKLPLGVMIEIETIAVK
jgi:2-iminobutanoate/2-iminopropanoate deaminase